MSIFIIKCLTYKKLPFVTPIFLCRPFPFRHPNIYKSDPSKNICVTDGSSQQTQHVLLDVLAMQNEDENGLDEIDFFGLTHIDGARIPTNNLVDESFTSELSIPTVNNPSGTTYKFNHIPTIKTDINNDLFKYHDNKDPNINWSRLIGFDDLFFVLQLNNPLEFSSNKTITFLFPPTDTITIYIQNGPVFSGFRHFHHENFFEVLIKFKKNGHTIYHPYQKKKKKYLA